MYVREQHSVKVVHQCASTRAAVCLEHFLRRRFGLKSGILKTGKRAASQENCRIFCACLVQRRVGDCSLPHTGQLAPLNPDNRRKTAVRIFSHQEDFFVFGGELETPTGLAAGRR